jgi:hypothetical protein
MEQIFSAPSVPELYNEYKVMSPVDSEPRIIVLTRTSSKFSSHTVSQAVSKLLNQLRVAVVRSEKLVAEAGGQFGNPEERGTSAVESHYQETASED